MPTPVGPKNKKLPIGRFSLESPALFRLTALAIASSASSCPTTFSFKYVFIFRYFSRCVANIFCTEIPVHLLKISATLSSSTRFLSKTPFSHIFSQRFSRSFSCACAAGILPYSISAAAVKSPFCLAKFALNFSSSMSFLACEILSKTLFSSLNLASSAFFVSFKFAISFSISFKRAKFASLSSIFNASRSTLSAVISRFDLANSYGSLSICILSSAAASSIKSIALSGKNLPLIYLSLRRDAATNALSLMLTP